MFLRRRPSNAEIEWFLDRSHNLPLSYGPTGIVRHRSRVDRLDEQVVTIGHGEVDFERARLALADWKHFGRRDSAAAMKRATSGGPFRS